MIKRNWTQPNLQDALFPVGEQYEIAWRDMEGRFHRIPGRKAIVDRQTYTTLSVVSNSYRLVTNQEAINLAEPIMKGVFGDNVSIKDFVPFNIYMPKSKASCRMDFIIPQCYYNPFGDCNNNWTPFIRITNSYNCTAMLKYTIGFCRWICTNGCIFGEKSLTLTFTHTHEEIPTPSEIKISAQKALGDIHNLWGEFQAKLQTLQKIAVSKEQVLAVFCQAFDLKIPQKINDTQREHLKERAEKIQKDTEAYFEEMGANAYAMLNILTDYASFPVGVLSTAVSVPSLQQKVGKWVNEIVKESEKKDFSIESYLSEAAKNDAKVLKDIAA